MTSTEPKKPDLTPAPGGNPALAAPRGPAKLVAVPPVEPALDVPFVRQEGEYDCWLAALRMIWKYRHGVAAEPPGHPAALQRGRDRDVERRLVKDNAALDQLDRRYALQKLPPIGLPKAGFGELARLNGLVAAELPPRDPGWSAAQLKALLTAHGPLWCALDFFHIIVVHGVDAAGQLVVNDPQAAAPSSVYPLFGFNDTLAWTQNCVLHLSG